MKRYLAFIICLLSLTGCFKRDNMEDITICTTIYPVEYITTRLYGGHALIESIYPNGVNIQLEKKDDEIYDLYTLTEKQLDDYSQTNLFIFNSLLYEGSYVKTMFNDNKNLKIINAADNLNIDDYYGLEEMWLDPSRTLTMTRNIKNGLFEYVTNYYLRQDIESNFNKLKEELDKLSSKFTSTTKNATNKIIVVNNNVFKFLSKEKYGLTVYSLDERNNIDKKTLEDIKSLINDGTIKYIYIREYDEVNDTIKDLIEGTNVEIIRIHMLTNLTETERNNKKDYFTIMNENIELLKKNLY